MIEVGKTYSSIGFAMKLYCEPDDHGDPVIEKWSLAFKEEDDDGDGWLEIYVHEIVETERSGTLAVYYRQWFNPEGEKLWSRKRKVGNLASLQRIISSRQMKVKDDG